ncbi:hypothetical protein Sros01_74040 [Streptomyces roseochromogenus]|nr:hypothetical protein Sros01_74040 [Streptomyces roseochromogenus]
MPGRSSAPSLLSPADRSARLREQLSGARGTSVSSLGASASVLVGTLLHAAARREQGLELTDLQLDALFGEGASEEFGRIYQEPASRANAAQLFRQGSSSRSFMAGNGKAPAGRRRGPSVVVQVWMRLLVPSWWSAVGSSNQWSPAAR